MTPLKGIRVLEFTHVWAGPFCGQLLADLGAEVIKVESAHRLDIHRRAGPYPRGFSGPDASSVWNAQNRGKLACRLDLKTPRGIDLARDLVAVSDVVIENFKPGTMQRLGLGFDALTRANPSMVLVSLSGYGQNGPLSRLPAYGPMMDAVGGLAYAARRPDGVPQSLNGWLPDVTAALQGAFAAVEGIRMARVTGQPSWCDVSEMETTLSLLPELVALATSPADTVWERSEGVSLAPVASNVVPGAVLAGVYESAVADSWVAVQLSNQDDVLLALDVLAEYSPSADGSPIEEAQMHSRLMDAIRRHHPQESVERLQAAGIEAVPVASIADLLNDHHLADRGAFMTVEHGVVGRFETYAPPIRAVGEVPSTGPAPTLGQHDMDVFTRILGLSSCDIERLESDGIIY